MIKKFSMVVWDSENGDVKNAVQMAVNAELAEETFEMLYGKNLKVLHVFEGEYPPKTYRSLPYID